MTDLMELFGAVLLGLSAIFALVFCICDALGLCPPCDREENV